MNVRGVSGGLSRLGFRAWRALVSVFPGGRISAFGADHNKINAIRVINLDRQPRRWRCALRELSRYRTSEGARLTSITRRLAAVDARDGRAVAATSDVDTTYRIRDQLYVQPDVRLEECFSPHERIRMTRQEVAVARSHIEAWKSIATGSDQFVLVLEDDIWFRSGAASRIDRGWRAALRRCRAEGGPHLLYFSYADAGGTAERMEPCDFLFRPARGLWFLSGYVLSREGAAALLRAMPVVGPVDLWINYRFPELRTLALTTPAILQRQDVASDNFYSIAPYLARAGIVDAGSGLMSPNQAPTGPVLAWTGGGERERLGMALSMLGLRVRVFDGDEEAIRVEDLWELLEVFDAVVDAPLVPSALPAAIAAQEVKFITEQLNDAWPQCRPANLPNERTVVLPNGAPDVELWRPVCTLLGLDEPAEPFPTGTPRFWRMFRDDRVKKAQPLGASCREPTPLDDSPWVLPPMCGWRSTPPTSRILPPAGKRLVYAPMTAPSPSFTNLVGTFPGNLASFTREGLTHDENGARLEAGEARSGTRPYRSAAFVSARSFEHGRFEAEIRAAQGSGLVTGFFLHRDEPRQEIDIELSGADPWRMLVNVYFNPGDDGTTLGYGYRGSPSRIDLGFDATAGFHLYGIDWRPGRIAWSVDGRIVHERASWDPTPIPHLPMRLNANLWIPRSEELAGRLGDGALPSTATFRNILIRA